MVEQEFKGGGPLPRLGRTMRVIVGPPDDMQLIMDKIYINLTQENNI